MRRVLFLYFSRGGWWLNDGHDMRHEVVSDRKTIEIRWTRHQFTKKIRFSIRRLKIAERIAVTLYCVMIIPTPTAARLLHNFTPDNMIMSNPPDECMCRCVCARLVRAASCQDAKMERPQFQTKLNYIFRFHKIDLLKFSSCLTYKFSFQRYVPFDCCQCQA